MKIGELEKISGIPRSTIHHYVNYGLLHRPRKTGRTTASYDTSHVKQLEAIEKIKREYKKKVKGSRIPLGYIKSKLGVTLSLIRPNDSVAEPQFVKFTTKQDKKKEKILKATLKLYSNRGYTLTSIRDVAQAAGISSPTFYRYFKDKRELFIETIEYVVTSFKSEIRESLKNEKNPSIRSRIMFDIFHAHYPKIGEILNQLRSGAIIGDQWAKNRLLSLYRDMMGDLFEEIKISIQRGIIKPVNSYLLTYFILAIDELAISLTSIDDTYSLDEVMGFVGNMFDNAFVTPKGKKYDHIFYQPGKAL